MISKKMLLFFLAGLSIICALGCSTDMAIKGEKSSIGHEIKKADAWITEHLW